MSSKKMQMRFFDKAHQESVVKRAPPKMYGMGIFDYKNVLGYLQKGNQYLKDKKLLSKGAELLGQKKIAATAKQLGYGYVDGDKVYMGGSFFKKLWKGVKDVGGKILQTAKDTKAISKLAAAAGRPDIAAAAGQLGFGASEADGMSNSSELSMAGNSYSGLNAGNETALRGDQLGEGLGSDLWKLAKKGAQKGLEYAKKEKLISKGLEKLGQNKAAGVARQLGVGKRKSRAKKAKMPPAMMSTNPPAMSTQGLSQFLVSQ